MNRIDLLFNKVKENNGKVFIFFVICGVDFIIEEIVDLVIELEKNNVIVVEIGVFFRDFFVDGLVI